ncbi:MAG TPA: bilirubin oxidase, partial [Rugosimonospora sp.]|nr:bilirubin oxidase [Rugosimonospora sp.]
MPTRRAILKTGTVAGAALLVPAAALVHRGRAAAATVAGGTLDPTTVPKYATPLFVLPAMPTAGTAAGVDVYQIEARQFTQQMLPAGYPRTTLFGFGAAGAPDTTHFPAYTIEATAGRPVRVTWVNRLVDASGGFLPHLLTVDQSIHWANPPGGVSGRDMVSTFTSTPGPYTGPVPLVVHLHGAHVTEESDGYPEAWYLPDATDIPTGYATAGSYYDGYKAQAASRYGVTWATGQATYQYANDQRATMLWYHSHELGMTRVNVYAGLAGVYLLRGGAADLAPGVLPGPGPR